MEFLYDNMKISYIDEGAGECILVLHGWGASIKSVRPIINLLTPHFRVISLDMVGCGDSDEPQRAYDLADYADLVHALCGHLGVRECAVIGHSNGGLVALRLNEEKKLKITKNILIDATGIRRKKSFKTKCKILSFKAAKALCLFPLWKSAGEKRVAKMRDRFSSEDYKNASPIMRATMSKLLSHDMSHMMGSISAPTLLIWGDKDTATPLYIAHEMEKRIKDCGLVVLQGAGHFSYIDCYAQFCAVLKSFLSF